MASWLSDGSDKKLKPVWEYRPGVKCIQALEGQPRQLAILTGELDPTGTWEEPAEIWVHKFKRGSQTVKCPGRFEKACFMCYANMIFESHNPNYREENDNLPRAEQKTPPYPLSRVLIVQAYDFQEQAVLWLAAGAQIKNGIGTLIQNEMYNNFINLGRTGKLLNTNYSVLPGQMTRESLPMDLIKDSIITLEQADNIWQMTDAEIQKKSGVNAAAYFEENIPKYGGSIDISGWGPIPKISHPIISTAIPNTPEIIPTTPNIIPETVPENATIVPNTPDVPELKHLRVFCSIGVNAGKKLGDLILSPGQAWFLFLKQSDIPDQEKEAVEYILANWDNCENFVSSDIPF